MLAWFRKAYLFVHFVIARFWEDSCTTRASALAYTTLLSIVPLMFVSFRLFAAFPVFKNFETQLQNFIFDNFVPATGNVVQGYIQQFAERTGDLSTFGLIFLVVSAVLVMFTIERALNAIWRVQKRRKGVSAFIMYWSMLTLAPILMVLSLAISSYIFSWPILSGTIVAKSAAFAGDVFLKGLPFLLVLAAFTLLYVAIPNTKVSFWHGLFGAWVAALLFEIAKQAFAYYVKSFSSYALIYGAFATIPMFLIWIYVVWIIVLLGAEIAHACSAQYYRKPGPKLDGMTHTLRWLKHLWLAQQQGESLSLQELMNLDAYNYQILPEEILPILIKNRLIRTSNSDRYILSRDLSKMSLYDLSLMLPWRLPSVAELQRYGGKFEMSLSDAVKPVDDSCLVGLNFPVSNLYNY